MSRYLKITLTDGTRFILRVTGETPRLVRGIEIDASGDEVVPVGAHQRLRIIERPLIKKTVEMRMNNKYATLEAVPASVHAKKLDAEIAMALQSRAHATKHIRTRGQMRADKRYTSAIKRKIKNACGTLCGAEPGHDDYDRATAASFIERFSKLKPEWIADMCSACREKAGI